MFPTRQTETNMFELYQLEERSAQFRLKMSECEIDLSLETFTG
jgi:hypothetical protein